MDKLEFIGIGELVKRDQESNFNKAQKKHQLDALRYLLSSQWPESDDLPTGDPIGDIAIENHMKDQENYTKMMAGRLINNMHKTMYRDCIGLSIKTPKAEDYIGYPTFMEVELDKPSCCNNSANHKKVFLITSAYKMCNVCKADLGDWE